MVASKGIEQLIHLNLLNKTFCFMKKGLSVIMLLPLLLLFFNNTAFRHQHVLPDGTAIEHAHYHRSDSDNSHDREDHQHTEKEILLFALISDSPVTVDNVYLLPEANQYETDDLKIPHPQNFSFNNPLFSYLLRAPPAVFSVSQALSRLNIHFPG